MKHDPHITLSVPPWDLPTPPISSAADDGLPTALCTENTLSTGRKSPAGALVGRIFMGRLNASDLDYMAKAILQMCDENHELRERVRRLEERLGIK